MRSSSVRRACSDWLARALSPELRAVASHEGAPWAWLVGCVAFAERTFAPVAAWTLVERGIGQKVLVTGVFGSLYAARTLAQRIALTRTEASVLARVAASILDSDILQTDILPDDDLRTKATEAVFRTSQLLAQILPVLCADLAACVILGIAVAMVEPSRLVAFAAVTTVLAAAALVVSRRTVSAAVDRAWRVQERAYAAFGDAMDGRFEIVASGHRDAVLQDLTERAAAWSVAGTRVAGAMLLSGRLALTLVAGLVAAALVVDARGRGAFAVTLADVAVFASVTPAFAGVAQGVLAFTRDRRWLDLVARVLGAARPRPTRPQPSLPPLPPLPPLPSDVTFAGISFRYAGAGRDALSEFSLAWKAGVTLAFAGSNGSGKSTLLRLLLALAEPSRGTIAVGGAPLATLDADAWRARVAFLSQRPYFPARADLRTAVRWPTSQADDARILSALQRVGLSPVLAQPPSLAIAVIDPLSVRVDTLSVGQRQRVALARLLCRDASLFLLDEPDANLDRDGIALVVELVRELAARGMVAYAAHTPELLAAADHVVTLEGGRVLAEVPS